MTVPPESPRATNAPAISSDMVAEFLREREGDEVSGITPLRQGGWSSAWKYEVGDRREVIRFSHIADDFERDRLASAWSSRRLPVPRFLDLGDAFGGKYAVTEWSSGVGLDSLDADGLRAVLPSLFAMLDAMRELEPPGPGYGGWDTAGNGSHQSWAGCLVSAGEDDAGGRLGDWRGELATSPVGTERLDAAVDTLRALASRLPDLRHVVHNDLINANVLVDGDRIKAVIDWGCGMTGDFLHDLALFAFYRPWYAKWHEVDVVGEYRRHAASIGPNLPDFDLRMTCSQISIGLGDVRYNVLMKDWVQAEWRLNRVMEVIEGR